MRHVTFGSQLTPAKQIGDERPAPPQAFLPQRESPRIATAGEVAGKRKRSRDVAGLQKFKEFIYSKSGFPRLHAMIEQNPILMFPPEGIVAARRQLLPGSVCASSHDLPVADDVHVPDRPMGGQYTGELGDVARRLSENSGSPTGDSATVEGADPSALLSISRRGKLGELANYHQQQLDVLVKIYYEFNHTALVKLPMRSTMDLLHRCGREAYAHIADWETQLRHAKQQRLEEALQTKSRDEHRSRLMEDGLSSYYDSQLVAAQQKELELTGQPYDREEEYHDSIFREYNTGAAADVTADVLSSFPDGFAAPFAPAGEIDYDALLEQELAQKTFPLEQLPVDPQDA